MVSYGVCGYRCDHLKDGTIIAQVLLLKQSSIYGIIGLEGLIRVRTRPRRH